MNALRRYRAAFVFVLIAFATTALVYNRLPDRLPMQWNLSGQVDSHLPKWWAAWIMPFATALVTTSLMWLLNPKRTSTIIVNTVAGFMCYMGGMSSYAAMHPADPPFALVFMGVGVFLIVVGNILGKLTWSYFVGIRTYWTMDDPDVWERTHRAAGPVYVLGGIAIFTAGIAHAATPILVALLLATCLYPIAYSYFAWRRG